MAFLTFVGFDMVAWNETRNSERNIGRIETILSCLWIKYYSAHSRKHYNQIYSVPFLSLGGAQLTSGKTCSCIVVVKLKQMQIFFLYPVTFSLTAYLATRKDFIRSHKNTIVFGKSGIEIEGNNIVIWNKFSQNLQCPVQVWGSIKLIH